MRYLIARIMKDQPIRFTLSVFVLAIAGMLEGAGIATLVPTLQIVGQGTAEATANAGTSGRIIMAVLAVLGLPFNLATALGATLFLVLASQVAVLVQQKLLAGSSARFEATLRKKLFAAVFTAGWPYFVRTKSNDVTSALITDTGRVGTAYVTIVTMIGTVIMVLVYLVLALVLSWQMTLAVLVASIVVLTLLRGRTDRGTKYGQELTATDAEIYGTAVENLVAAKLIKASSSETRVIDDFNRLTEVRQRIQYKNLMNMAWLKVFYDSASITVMFVGIYLAVTFFGMTTATLTVFLFVFYRLSPRVSQLQASQSFTLSMIPGLKTVDEFIANATAMHEESGAAPLSALSTAIELHDVSFAYGDNAVLHDVSLTIPRGSSTAIVGPSGSGKTTVMDLVLGLLTPQDGDVLLDGVPLRDVRLADWRKQIGYVAQDSSFFHATINENIGWGLDDISADDVVQAAKLARADEFISELPEGYDTIIGDRGVRLSGGQRQRLALARAIVRKPSILVLDEATSALDAKSEERIQRAVDDLAGSMTILTVTHRLATVKNAELIYVLENGRLVESGSWGELLAAKGRFSELVSMQSLGHAQPDPAE